MTTLYKKIFWLNTGFEEKFWDRNNYFLKL